MEDTAKYEDVIGQLARLKTYTHLLTCFPLHDETSQVSVTKSLEDASQTLSLAFPWLACKVVNEGSGPGNSGVFRLKTCPLFSLPNSLVRVQDCSDVCPPYRHIVKAQGPVHMLDGQLLGPVKAFPETYQETEENPAPVFVIQANFIRGGLLLDAAAQHNFIDGGGLFQCMRLFAKAMRGETFSDFELEQGNRDRRHLIALLGKDEPLLDHSHLRRPPLAEDLLRLSESTVSRAPAAWRFYRFPASKIAELKAKANSDVTSGTADPSISFVSTNDAISAFIWKSLAEVRLKRFQRPKDVSKFSRALDVRRVMGIPREYMGQMGYNASCTLTFEDLENGSLGAVAATLRKTVRLVNTQYSVRSWVTLIAGEPDKSTIMFGGSFNPDNDIGLSSLVHAELYSVAFGALGRPELVRRPNFRPLEGCVYLWSQTEAGDIDVLTCFNHADVEGLKQHSEWQKCIIYIG